MPIRKQSKNILAPTGYRAICSRCDWKARRKHATEGEAFEYGMEEHGNPKNHVIDTEETHTA